MASNKKLERQTAGDFLADVAEAPPSPESLTAQAEGLQRQAVAMQVEAQRLATARAEAEQLEATRERRETTQAALETIRLLDQQRLALMQREFVPMVERLMSMNMQMSAADTTIGHLHHSEYAFSGGSPVAAAAAGMREKAGLAPGIGAIAGFTPVSAAERLALHLLATMLKR